MTTLFMKRLSAVSLFTLFFAHLGYGAEPINLRVVWAEKPQTQATVLWDSFGDGKGVLLVREGDETKTHDASVAKYSNYIHPKKLQHFYDGKKPPMLSNCYSVKLANLKPSTKYVLAAKVGDESTKEHYFITAPDKDVAFKIFFAGDSRSRVGAARKVSELIRKEFEKDPSYIALLHGGDYTKDSGTEEYTPWLEAYYMTTTADGRLLPIILVQGNHDRGSGFAVAYGLPRARLNAYTCMLSPEVGLLVPGGEEFLKTELAKLDEKKVRYRLAAYHRPIYPAVKGPSNAKKVYAPLFEKYNVDLGLESDGHCIKRTVPIRNDKKAEGGTVYLGEGGYGAPQKSPKRDRWYLKPPGFTGNGEHYMVLSFTKEAIEYSTIQLGKGKVDSATFPAKDR